MTEFLLAIIILLVWRYVRKKKEWYVVEWRRCSDKNICDVAFSSPVFGYDKVSLDAHNLHIERASHDGANLRHAAGGEIRISQEAFGDIDAAHMYFDQIKHLFEASDSDVPYQKLYLWRIVARSREKALTVPPEKYASKDGRVLLECPERFWYGRKD